MHLTLDHHAAVFTAITDDFAAWRNEFFKISSFYLMDFKTFWTAAASKLIFRYSKMTVPAAQLVVFNRYQRKNLMFAGTHNSYRKVKTYRSQKNL